LREASYRESEGESLSVASVDVEVEQMGGAGRRAVSPPASEARPRIPVHSDLKRMMGDFRIQDFVGRESDADEYDIPTFLRKHAD